MAIFRAIDSGDTDEVTRLLDADSTVLEGTDPEDLEGLTPLVHAIQADQLDMVKLLTGRGAIMHGDSLYRRRTALHWAVLSADDEMVAYLLDNGAMTSQRDDTGYTPLVLAARSCRPRVALLLLEHMGLETMSGNDGSTALCQAVLSGYEPLVGSLLDHGARADTTDRFGTSVLRTAVEKDHLGIVKLLVDRLGPEALQERDNRGRSLLHVATQKAFEEIADYLLRSGLMPTVTDQEGSTPLMYACARSGCAEVFGKLLEYMNGEALDQRNAHGRTALHWAVGYDRSENVRRLLLAGANPRIVDNHGRTPRVLAEQRHHPASAAVLQRWDAEVERRSVLYRARTLHDAYTTYQEAPTRPVPGYLKARVEAGLELPHVEALAGEQYEGWEWDRYRTRGATRFYVADMFYDLAAMLELVVEGLSEELFKELLQGFHAWGSEG